MSSWSGPTAPSAISFVFSLSKAAKLCHIRGVWCPSFCMSFHLTQRAEGDELHHRRVKRDTLDPSFRNTHVKVDRPLFTDELNKAVNALQRLAGNAWDRIACRGLARLEFPPILLKLHLHVGLGENGLLGVRSLSKLPVSMTRLEAPKGRYRAGGASSDRDSNPKSRHVKAAST